MENILQPWVSWKYLLNCPMIVVLQKLHETQGCRIFPVDYIYIYIHKQDLALNNIQGLICQQTNSMGRGGLLFFICTPLFPKYSISFFFMFPCLLSSSDSKEIHFLFSSESLLLYSFCRHFSLCFILASIYLSH